MITLTMVLTLIAWSLGVYVLLIVIGSGLAWGVWFLSQLGATFADHGRGLAARASAAPATKEGR